MFNMDDLLMIAAAFLLLVVNALAFHDIFEPHTVRDWLMLVASALVLVHFAKVFWDRNFAHH
jgi:hypothetical protein